jgi:hypothetical protein
MIEIRRHNRIKNTGFIGIMILTGVLYSCGIRQDLNGTWVGEYGSIPDQPGYVNHLPELNDTNQITVINDTIMPGVTRDTAAVNNGRFTGIGVPRSKYLTVSGRNVTLSYSLRNMTDSPILFRTKYHGKYKQRNGRVIAIFDIKESINMREGNSEFIKCEQFMLTFYYSKSTQTLYELDGNDTTVVYTKYEEGSFEE